MASPIFFESSLPWAIDMDGTLIREDVTELAIQRCLHNPLLWHKLLYALFLWLISTKAHSHRFMEIQFPPNPKQLSYNQDLINRIVAHRQRGGHVVLATAAHHQIGTIVAKHVGLFDDVIGSCCDDDKFQTSFVMDAAATVKAQLLSSRFPQGFVYAGNSMDDIPVWECNACKAMMIVACKPKVLELVQSNKKPFVIID